MRLTSPAEMAWAGGLSTMLDSGIFHCTEARLGQEGDAADRDPDRGIYRQRFSNTR